MCTGAEIAGLALAAGGTGLNFVANQRSLGAQEDAAEAALRRQQALDERAQAAIGNAIEIFAPERREATQAGIEARLTEQFQGDLERERIQGAGTLGAPVEGKTSPAFETERARVAGDQLAKAIRLAALRAKVAAPGRARQEEAFDLADIRADRGTIERESERVAFNDAQQLARLRERQRRGVDNPFLRVAAELTSAAAPFVASRQPSANLPRPRTPPRTLELPLADRFAALPAVRVPALR